MNADPVLTTGVIPCPICNRSPKLVKTYAETVFLMCFGHRETRAYTSEEEAMKHWNAGDYDTENRPRTPQT